MEIRHHPDNSGFSIDQRPPSSTLLEMLSDLAFQSLLAGNNKLFLSITHEIGDFYKRLDPEFKSIDVRNFDQVIDKNDKLRGAIGSLFIKYFKRGNF